MRYIIIIAGAVIGYFWMKRVKSAIPQGQVIQDSLNKKEKIYVWLLSFASPLVTGAIFYYGWRNALPKKARSVNFISWIAFAILIIISYTSIFLWGFNLLNF